jgi:hypothetical protein
MTMDCLGQSHFMIQNVGNFAFSRDWGCMALQAFIAEISRGKTHPVPGGNLFFFFSKREILY